MTVKINIDNKTIVKILGTTFIFLFVFSFVAATRQAVTIILIAAFLAMALNPPVSYLSSKITGGSRAAATAIAYVLVLSVIGFFVWAMVPPLVSQTRAFVSDLPTYIEDASEGDSSIAQFIRDNDIEQEVQDYIDEYRFSGAIGDTSARLFSGIERIGVAIASLLTVLVMTFFMLVEGPAWLEKFWQLQPADKRQGRREIGKQMYGVITGYVNGQLLIALMAATSSLIMMLIVGLPLPLPLAGVVGLFGLIPLVGATLGSVVVIGVALFQSVPTAIAMLVFFLVYQQIENNFIQPVIQSRTLNVSPLLVFIAVLLGINIGGILGAFAAIPTAACVRIIFNEYLEARQSTTKKNTPKGRLLGAVRKGRSKKDQSTT